MTRPYARRVPSATWGDSEARRRDVLEAAAAILERDGYGGLTMRALAKDAGVSPATIYHHFADKGAVLTALMEARIEALRRTLAAAPRTEGVAAVLRSIVPDATEMWRTLGRTSASWARGDEWAGLDASRPSPVTAESWRKMQTELHAALEQSAVHDGQRLLGGRAVVPFVWAALVGMADDLVNGWSRSEGIGDDELIRFTVHGLARAVTEPPVEGRKE